MRLLALVSCFSLLAACGDDSPTGGAGEGGGQASGAGSPTAGNGSGAGSTGGAGDGGAGDGGASAGGNGTGGDAMGGQAGFFDPNMDGPFAVTSFTGSTEVDATGDTVPISGWAPNGQGPFPTIVVAHGFQLPASQYDSYAHRLATFGYVAITPDYPTSFFGLSHVDVAEDLLGTLDWAASAPELAGKADVDEAGMVGHSLGGKASLLAATMDARVKAVLALDPVDSSMSCSPQDCPDVSNLMSSLQIPTGFLGETTDASGGFQPCAPAADNYTTFYAGATSPSFSVTVLGANHMSFLDDAAGCGFTCSFCQPASAPNATVNAMARAYAAAFFERYLRDDAAYEPYLIGAEAEARYVTTGQATIVFK